MKEFSLSSADKYKDGSPMMLDLPVQLIRLTKRIKCLEQHMEQITINEGNIDALSSDVEDLQKKVYQIYKFLNAVDPDFFAEISKKPVPIRFDHICSDFCGNCTHSNSTDGIYTCKLNKGIVDPDDSSCSMFEPPF